MQQLILHLTVILLTYVRQFRGYRIKFVYHLSLVRAPFTRLLCALAEALKSNDPKNKRLYIRMEGVTSWDSL